MKNKFKLLALIALVAVMVSVTGCVTASSIGGTAGPHGFFTGNGAGKVNTDGATEIGSYSVILGIVDSGYEAYDAAVKAAISSGKQVTSTTTWLFVLYKVTAYAK